MPEIDPNEGKVDREFQLISVVGIVDTARMGPPISLDQETLESMEREMGHTIRLVQAVSDRGPGLGLEIQRRRLDILSIGERVEVRSQEGSFSAGVATEMAQFLSLTYGTKESMPWQRIGFNFILPLQTNVKAIEYIAQVFFKDDLVTRLGFPVQGAAAWVWLEIDGGTLWLKLQPLRDSVTTGTIIANANVTIPIEEQPDFPNADGVARKLTHYCTQLDTVLKATGL